MYPPFLLIICSNYFISFNRAVFWCCPMKGGVRTQNHGDSSTNIGAGKANAIRFESNPLPIVTVSIKPQVQLMLSIWAWAALMAAGHWRASASDRSSATCPSPLVNLFFEHLGISFPLELIAARVQSCAPGADRTSRQHHSEHAPKASRVWFQGAALPTLRIVLLIVVGLRVPLNASKGNKTTSSYAEELSCRGLRWWLAWQHRALGSRCGTSACRWR